MPYCSFSAILAFAVHASLQGLDLGAVGWIIMAAVVLGLVVDLAVLAPRRRVLVTRTAGYRTPASVVERDVYSSAASRHGDGDPPLRQTSVRYLG